MSSLMSSRLSTSHDAIAHYPHPHSCTSCLPDSRLDALISFASSYTMKRRRSSSAFLAVGSYCQGHYLCKSISPFMSCKALDVCMHLQLSEVLRVTNQRHGDPAPSFLTKAPTNTSAWRTNAGQLGACRVELQRMASKKKGISSATAASGVRSPVKRAPALPLTLTAHHAGLERGWSIPV
jgi:hypothetical protein